MENGFTTTTTTMLLATKIASGDSFFSLSLSQLSSLYSAIFVLLFISTLTLKNNISLQIMFSFYPLLIH
jgi:hypothetical protein